MLVYLRKGGWGELEFVSVVCDYDELVSGLVACGVHGGFVSHEDAAAVPGYDVLECELISVLSFRKKLEVQRFDKKIINQ